MEEHSTDIFICQYNCIVAFELSVEKRSNRPGNAMTGVMKDLAANTGQ
jgi:hypothetical protein